jgi:hypothetical protein
MKWTAVASLLVLVLSVVAGTAAVPQTMSYQGVLRDAGGSPVPDGDYGLTFGLYTQDIGGALLWTETQTVTVADGIFDAILGTVTPLSIEFAAQYWLGISVEGEAELTPRVQLSSVPYALRADSIDPNVVSSVDGVTNDEGNIDLVAGSNITITPNDPANTITISAAGGGDDGDWTISGSDVYRLFGNVGIGTGAPGHDLSIYRSGATTASAHFTNDVTGPTVNDGLVMGVSSSGRPYIIDQEGTLGLTIGSGGVNTMTLYPAGAVIDGSAAVYGGLSVEAFDMDTGATTGYVLTADASGNGTWQAPAAVADDDWTISGGNVYRANGNVGIGTTNPVDKLHVDGGILVPYNGAYHIGDVLYKGMWWNSSTGSIAYGDETEPIEVYAGSTTPRATVATSGFIGIGTTSPYAQLDVHATATDAIAGYCDHGTAVDYVGVTGYSAPVDFYGVGGSFLGGWRGLEARVAPSGENTYVGGNFNVNGGLGANYGVYSFVNGFGSNYAVYGYKSGGGDYAGYFYGNVHATGSVTWGSARSRVDHPLDPENMYLNHCSVESQEMKNIYDGVAVLGSDGTAWVEMPEWFGAYNTEFRYQLTCVGGYAQVYVAEEIRGNRFRIAGGTPGLKVSWQVTGVRHDAFADAERVPVEEMKPADERGLYAHPQAFGLGEDMSAEYRRQLEMEQKEAEARDD